MGPLTFFIFCKDRSVSSDLLVSPISNILWTIRKILRNYFFLLRDQLCLKNRSSVEREPSLCLNDGPCATQGCIDLGIQKKTNFVTSFFLSFSLSRSLTFSSLFLFLQTCEAGDK